MPPAPAHISWMNPAVSLLAPAKAIRHSSFSSVRQVTDACDPHGANFEADSARTTWVEADTAARGSALESGTARRQGVDERPNAMRRKAITAAIWGLSLLPERRWW
jgi:hypothetical protein